MTNGATIVPERNTETTLRRTIGARFIARRRIARASSDAVVAFLLSQTAALSDFETSGVGDAFSADANLSQTVVDPDSADFYLEASHALVAELRILVALRASFASTDH